LPQAYQRWLYKDYAYLWKQQSAVVRQFYATVGSRNHLTGFQCWMKYLLTNLPDIAAWWKLDELIGATLHDSSRSGNNGTIIGCTPVNGLIGGALSFDGNNDRLVTPASATLTDFTTMSLNMLIRPGPFDGTFRYLVDANYWRPRFGFIAYFQPASDNLSFYWKNTAGVVINYSFNITPDADLPLGFTWDGSNIHVYVNGIDVSGAKAFVGTLACSAAAWSWGWQAAVSWYDGLMDNIIIHNRCLDSTEMLRWSQRRWSP